MTATIRKRRACLPAGALLVALAGCGGIVKNPTPFHAAAAETVSPAALEQRYTINAGDELEIVFFHTPDLNLTLPVRPDGYVSLPLAHEVLAAGRTPEALRQELTAAFAQELEDPEIAVIVRTFAGARVHVGGEVDQPGVYPLLGHTTVMDSIMGAGLLTRSARLDEVLVIRRDVPNKSYKIIPLNLKKVIDGTEPEQNITLVAFDAVYVPTSGIADVNTFVDMYIRRNMPVDFGLRIDVFR